MLSVKAQTVREPSKVPMDPFDFMQRLGPVVFRSVSEGSNLIGMFSVKGTKVLPFSFYNIMNYPLNVPITDNLIFLLDSNTQRYQQAGFEVLGGFEVKPAAFLRNGITIYNPYWYDNGVDYFKEGRQRFVYDNKIGFVNRLGQVTVWANYSYIEAYNNAYALACTNCVYAVLDSTDKEHCCGFKGNNWVVINKEGKEIKRLRVIQGERLDDQLPQTKQTLSALEKTRAAKLLALPEIKMFANDMQVSVKKLNMVLYDKPFKHSPYYHFGLQSVNDTFSGDDYQFLISPDGKTILHIDNTLQKIKTLKDWRRELQTQSAK